MPGVTYRTLVDRKLVEYYYINQGPTGNFKPLASGSWVSKLTRLLESEHGKVKVDDQGRRAIYAWIDANVPYYGTWEMTRPYTIGGRDAYAKTLGTKRTALEPWVKKFDDFAARRNKNIYKIPRGGSLHHGGRGMINLTHPEASPVLLNLLAKSAGGRATGENIYFQSKDDPNYIELRSILQEAKDAVEQAPRMDMPGGKAIPQKRNFGRTFRCE